MYFSPTPPHVSDVGRGGVRGGGILYPLLGVRHAEQCRRIYIYNSMSFVVRLRRRLFSAQPSGQTAPTRPPSRSASSTSPWPPPPGSSSPRAAEEEKRKGKERGKSKKQREEEKRETEEEEERGRRSMK